MPSYRAWIGTKEWRNRGLKLRSARMKSVSQHKGRCATTSPMPLRFFRFLDLLVHCRHFVCLLLSLLSSFFRKSFCVSRIFLQGFRCFLCVFLVENLHCTISRSNPFYLNSTLILTFLPYISLPMGFWTALDHSAGFRFLEIYISSLISDAVRVWHWCEQMSGSGINDCRGLALSNGIV